MVNENIKPEKGVEMMLSKAATAEVESRKKILCNGVRGRPRKENKKMIVEHTRRRISLILFAILSISSFSSAEEITNICSLKEVIYFNCQADKEILSLCGLVSGSKLRGLQVRLGNVKSLKLVYPNSMDNSLQAFKFSRYTRPLVTYLKISLEMGPAKDELYSDSSYGEVRDKDEHHRG
jgi:hypothetical protein